MSEDLWAKRSFRMHCDTCIFYVPKGEGVIGRCRRHAPTMNGFPAVYPQDFCGDHKIDEAKISGSPPSAKASVTIPSGISTSGVSTYGGGVGCEFVVKPPPRSAMETLQDGR